MKSASTVSSFIDRLPITATRIPKQILELNGMGELASGETEAGLEVAQEDLPLGVCLDRFKHLFVYRDLIGFAGGRRLVSLLLLGENVALSLLEALLALAAEISVVDVGRNLDLANVQLGARRDDEVLVDSTDRHAVHLVGTC